MRSTPRTTLTLALTGLTLTAGAALAAPPDGKGKPPPAPTVEIGCVDIVTGSLQLLPGAGTPLPNGTVVPSTEGVITGSMELAAPTCRAARYTLEVRSSLPEPVRVDDGSDVVDPRTLPVIASQTVKGDELDAFADFRIAYRDLAAPASVQGEVCVYLTGYTSSKDVVVDEAPDATEEPVLVCPGSPALSSFK